MEGEPSASAAGTSKAAAHYSATGTSPGAQVVQEAAADSTSGSSPPAVLEQQELFFNARASIKQCHQLFGSTCCVKIQRCEVPPSTASGDNASHTSTQGPTASTTVTKKENEGHYSYTEDEVKILPVPPAKQKGTGAVAKKKRGKRVSNRKSSARCRVCRKTLNSKYYLKVHLRKHTGEGKRYSCGICGRSFWRHSKFSIHTKTRNERNGVCPSERKRSGGWRPKGAWNCKICGKKMSHPNYYLTHMRRHWDEKSFKCKDCEKAFRTSADLSSHKWVHRDDWKYTCVFCEKGFKHHNQYWTHLRVHTEEKPFLCLVDRCGDSFGQLESLKRHRRVVHRTKY